MGTYLKCGRLLSWVVFLCLVSVGCKAKIEKSNIAFIIGDDEMETLDSNSSEYINNKDIVDSSVLILTTSSSGTSQFCSGVLVNTSMGLKILTNHHCFAYKDDKDQATAELLPSACVNTSVFFNLIENSVDEVEKLDCVEGSLKTDYRADLASFSIRGALPKNANPIELSMETNLAGREALIVHFPVRDSHARYVRKYNISLPIATITEKNCRILGEFPEDLWGEVGVLYVSHRHTCDLIKGSSGSPLIDVRTRKLVGVNWGGVEYKTSKVRKDNAATNSVCVKAFLESKNDDKENNCDLSSLATESNKQASAEKRKSIFPACGTIGSVHANVKLISLLSIFLPIFFVLLRGRAK